MTIPIYHRRTMNGPYSRSGFSAYQSSKTAVNRFAEFLNAEYGSKGIRAFSYHPGKPWRAPVVSLRLELTDIPFQVEC